MNEFAGDPPSNPFIDRTYAFVIGHTWMIGANKTNSFFIGETVQKLRFPDYVQSNGVNLSYFRRRHPGLPGVVLYLNPARKAVESPFL